MTYTDIKIANNTKIHHIMVSFTGHYNAFSTTHRLPSKTEIGKDSWKRFRKIILFHISPIFPQLQRHHFLLKTQKTTTLQQVTCGNTLNIVLKTMLNSIAQKNILQF